MSVGRLIVGITGHYGAGRTTVANILETDSGFENISLSSFLRSSADEHLTIEELQQRGDDLRRAEGEDALAKRALAEMQKQNGDCYVIDGIKHPNEAKTLAIDGNFFLLAVQADTEARWQRKQDDLGDDRNQFNRIDAIDNKETDSWGMPVEHGQRVADCLLLADAFIWNDAPLQSSTKDTQRGTLPELRRKIARFHALITNPGREAPSRFEVLMAQAYLAAQLSSCLQRKVGAIITNNYYRIIAEGYNEVPDTEGSCDEVFGGCYRNRIREQDLRKLSQLFKCGQCGGPLSVDLECQTCGPYSQLLPKRQHLDYCRALHAEERAILQCSRYGGVGLEGSTMFCTTFPCALCAKKIVDCAIGTVIFVEPYKVKDAFDFFRDAKTQLICFEGFAARAFQRVFRS